jgi:hypothetical protein
MNCSKCGSIIEENYKFCKKCATSTSRIPVNGIPNFSVSTSILFKGMLIGISATIMAICSWVAYSTFIDYSRQYSQLIALGASPNDAHHVLLELPGTIGICVAGAIYSSYLLVITVLDYFSPTVRALINSKKLINRIGNGLVTGGVISISFSSMYYIFDLYSTSTIKIDPNHIFALIGLILLTAGISLFAILYFRTHRQATKV